MKAAANNAIIACFNLMSCQGLIFAQQSEGERPDITIVPYDYLPSVRFLKADLVGIGYNNYPWVLYDIITWNIKNRPIYVVNLPNNYYDFLGIDFGFMHYVPMEYFGQLTQKIPLVLPQNNYQMTQGLITQKLPDWDMMRQTVKVNVAKDHIFNASIWFKMGQRNLAYQEMNLATNLFYGFEENERKQITQIREMVERTSPNNFFKLGYGVEKTAFIIDQSNELYKEGLSKRALQIAQGAVTVDPTNIKARINWADIMESVGATDSAILEYNNVLKLEPTNKEAKEKIAKFSHTNSNTITPGFGLQE
jgi:tetratricopeptide (TPR) repeat protein